MGREMARKTFRSRFQIGIDPAMIGSGKERSMEPLDAPAEEPQASSENPRARPRASQWLWRPWYAKLWWACSALYWAGKLASYWSDALNDAYSTALAGYLNVALYPVTVLLVLGVRFVLPWMDYHGWEWVEPSHEQMFPKRSVGGMRDPNSDPLDPRSGSLWIGSPENQAKLFDRH